MWGRDMRPSLSGPRNSCIALQGDSYQAGERLMVTVASCLCNFLEVLKFSILTFLFISPPFYVGKISLIPSLSYPSDFMTFALSLSGYFSLPFMYSSDL